MVFRPSPETRALLDDAVKESGESLSAEVDRRLRQSFWSRTQQYLQRDNAFGGNHNFALGFLIARIASGVEHRCGESWREDPLVWREAATAIVGMLQLMRGFRGGSFPLPIGEDARPDQQWDVMSFSSSAPGGTTETRQDPHWFHILRLLDIMLEKPVPLHWPLVDTIKQAHDDFRDDFIPSAQELRELYATTGTATAEVPLQP